MRIPDGELKKLLLDSGLVKQQDIDDATSQRGCRRIARQPDRPERRS